MRRYLAELHKKSDHHKRRFALLASGTITLFIFGVWSLATFGVDTRPIAESKSQEIGPFQLFARNMANSFEALKGTFGAIKSSFKGVDFEAEYQEMKKDTLDIYGQ